MSRVLVIGDTHAPGMRTGYIPFLKSVAKRYKTNRVVHIGDLVDWASISFHEKNPSISNTEVEFSKAKAQVKQLATAFPKADWLIGNHDSLTERQANTVGLPAWVLRDYAELWGVKWKVHPRFSKILIDGVIYMHGDAGRGGQDAALANAKDNFRSTVIGHHHSQAGVKFWCNRDFRVFGMSVGCGMDRRRLEFNYGKKFTQKPILGCGVVIDGKRAYFEPWLLGSR